MTVLLHLRTVWSPGRRREGALGSSGHLVEWVPGLQLSWLACHGHDLPFWVDSYPSLHSLLLFISWGVLAHPMTPKHLPAFKAVQREGESKHQTNNFVFWLFTVSPLLKWKLDLTFSFSKDQMSQKFGVPRPGENLLHFVTWPRWRGRGHRQRGKGCSEMDWAVMVGMPSNLWDF